MASIFTKIIQGDLPAYKVYEDDLVIGFLSIQPIKPGHTLLVPKIEVDHFFDVPEPHYSHTFQVAKKVGKAIQAATNCKRVGTMIQGFEIPHFHYHLVPLSSPSELDFALAKSANPDEFVAMRDRILKELERL